MTARHTKHERGEHRAEHQSMSSRPPFDRVCIRCRNGFRTRDRFQFICDLCHALDEWRGADVEAPQ